MCNLEQFKSFLNFHCIYDQQLALNFIAVSCMVLAGIAGTCLLKDSCERKKSVTTMDPNRPDDNTYSIFYVRMI